VVEFNRELIRIKQKRPKHDYKFALTLLEFGFFGNSGADIALLKKAKNLHSSNFVIYIYIYIYIYT